FGRILAERMGYSLKCDGLPEFPNTQTGVTGASYDVPEERLISGFFFIDHLVSNSEKRKIFVDGHFQNYRYFKAYRDQIRQWFEYPAGAHDVSNATVVHVRRGDYVTIGWALPFSYYKDAIAKVWDGTSPLFIATDDREDPFFKNFAQYEPQFIDAPPVDTIMTMSRAKNMVMSRSSFSWWAAFLGQHEKVVCPKPNEGFWSEAERDLQSVDLIDEQEFVCVPCDGVYTPDAAEKRYFFLQKLRKKLRIPRRSTPSDFHR
ncbi:MAG: alpha-1,2-fucosyltransferase, partial [Bacteroidota bacterium]